MKSFVEKNWYTLDEALKRLAARFNDLNESDLLQLAIEGRTTLCVVFSEDVPAFEYRQVREEDIAYVEVPNLAGTATIKLPADGDVVYDRHKRPHQKTNRNFVLNAGDACRLAMIGGEMADVQDRLWTFLGKERQETTNIDGTFCFADMEEGDEQYSSLFQILQEFEGEQEGYYPAGRLPESAIFALSHDDLVELLGGTQVARPSEKASPWPWGSHRTKLLSHLDAAARRFWVNFDPSDSSTAPTNEQVSSWLQTNGVSQRNADVMASILRADGLPTGPRPRLCHPLTNRTTC